MYRLPDVSSRCVCVCVCVCVCFAQTALVEIDGVQTPEDARYYLGKRVAYIYYAKKSHKAVAYSLHLLLFPPLPPILS
ncbi:MAG: 50S ribosomal protein L35ae [Runella zeae]